MSDESLDPEFPYRNCADYRANLAAIDVGYNRPTRFLFQTVFPRI